MGVYVILSMCISFILIFLKFFVLNIEVNKGKRRKNVVIGSVVNGS